jgi:tRNA/rRNA methyltransferase|tara:strand:+ start:112 stop:855 length:744 start_codon:yes stop_codon:yes gene_type:complete
LKRPQTVVVLVEPAGPINVGSVARLCANFEVRELRLVSPVCDPMDPEACRMAVHGLELLRTARSCTSLLEAVADCRRVVASCGRLDHGSIPLHAPEEALGWLLTGRQDQSDDQPVAVVFGREDRGLSNDELRLCQRVLTLHSSGSYPSLNLSHAVAVVLHELARLQTLPEHDGDAEPDPAPPRQLDHCLEDASDLLLDVGFLLPHTAAARMNKVRDLLQRASIQAGEVALIRGMVRQLRWALTTRRP